MGLASQSVIRIGGARVVSVVNGDDNIMMIVKLGWGGLM